MLLEMWVEVKVHSYHARARVCRQLYVLRASHALVQATAGVGTVIIVCIEVAYTGGGGGGSCSFFSVVTRADEKILQRADHSAALLIEPHPPPHPTPPNHHTSIPAC